MTRGRQVHDRMNESIENNCEVNIAIVVGAKVEPVEKEYCEVMIYVQKRKLLPAALRDNKKCVHEVEHLGDVK